MAVDLSVLCWSHLPDFELADLAYEKRQNILNE